MHSGPKKKKKKKKKLVFNTFTFTPHPKTTTTTTTTTTATQTKLHLTCAQAFARRDVVMAHRAVARAGREEGGTAEEHGVLVAGGGGLQALEEVDEVGHLSLALVAQQVGEGRAVKSFHQAQLVLYRDALARWKERTVVVAVSLCCCCVLCDRVLIKQPVKRRSPRHRS